MARNILYRGSVVITPSLGNLEIQNNWLIGVDNQGLISHSDIATSTISQELIHSVSSSKGSYSDLVNLPPGSFLLPTFCDLHLHAPQFLYRGTGLDLPLLEWLKKHAFSAESKLDADPALAKRVYETLARRLGECGTGTVLLFGTIGIETNLILAEAMQSAGIRAFIGKVSMDTFSPSNYTENSAPEALDNAREFLGQFECRFSSLCPSERRVEPVITPRFVPTCTDELLDGLGQLAQNGSGDGKILRVQSHMAESHDVMEYVPQTRGGLSDLEIFDQRRLLTPQTVQAHCTYVQPQTQFSLLHERGTAIAHCPLSNAYFSSAQPFPLRQCLDANVKVGLGTDIAGGYSLDITNSMRSAVMVSRMWEAMRAAKEDGGTTSKNPRPINWKEALYLATKGGYEALGLPNFGTFIVGTPFDAQQIQLFDKALGSGTGPLDFFGDELDQEINEEMVEKWWSVGDQRNRLAVWVQGTTLYRGPA
ncbi:Metallo-dependent hydrolase [Pluteus cervinus]|uniref:Metallo-dependent hydrolase n=1 Tax=Pluteus cervinus TaxID=181527 RepID=A0ACD3AX18_9AGAR|nr:Metallo-dependent hydrolase [Pluteus cervinus]